MQGGQRTGAGLRKGKGAGCGGIHFKRMCKGQAKSVAKKKSAFLRETEGGDAHWGKYALLREKLLGVRGGFLGSVRNQALGEDMSVPREVMGDCFLTAGPGAGFEKLCL